MTDGGGDASDRPSSLGRAMGALETQNPCRQLQRATEKAKEYSASECIQIIEDDSNDEQPRTLGLLRGERPSAWPAQYSGHCCLLPFCFCSSSPGGRVLPVRGCGARLFVLSAPPGGEFYR